MAIKISDLPTQIAANISAADVLPITDAESNITRKVTTGALVEYLQSNGYVGYTGSTVVGYTGSFLAGYTGSAGSIRGYTGSSVLTNSLTFGNGLGGYVGSASNPVVSFSGQYPVTTAIDTSVVVTLDDGQTLTNKIIDSPRILNELILEGPGVGFFTPFPDISIGAFKCNADDYREISFQNVLNGVNSSADFVLYNDASDVNSYFLDMGLNSSLYDSVDYPLFTANSGYIYTGGGSGGGGSQASNLFIGTSSPYSDIVFFTEGVDVTNRVMIISHTGNILIGTTNDNFQHILQIQGDVSVGGHIMSDVDGGHDIGEPGIHWKKLYLTSDGGIEFRDGYRVTNSTLGTQCDPGVDTVVKSADLTDIRSAKVFIQIQGNEDGDSTGMHTQCCDLIAIRRVATGGINTVDSVAYGVIYTSVAPIATVDARWNALTNAIEITARPTSVTNPVYVRVNMLEVARFII